VIQYEKQLERIGVEAKMHSPILLPEYRNLELLRRHRQEFDPFLPAGL
jgi:hypothetical protein